MKDQILKQLNWRYATKVFDKTKKLVDEDLNLLLESLRLTPSSYGLQPWKFIVVKNKDLREKIKNFAYGQSQVIDASELIVLCAKSKFSESDIEKVTGDNVGYKNLVMKVVESKTSDELLSWNSKQVYIALGFLLETCALMEIDSCPMEGFDSSKVDEILGLTEKGLTSVLLCPVGYRSTDDKYASRPKSRFLSSELIEVM